MLPEPWLAPGSPGRGPEGPSAGRGLPHLEGLRGHLSKQPPKLPRADDEVGAGRVRCPLEPRAAQAEVPGSAGEEAGDRPNLSTAAAAARRSGQSRAGARLSSLDTAASPPHTAPSEPGARAPGHCSRGQRLEAHGASGATDRGPCRIVGTPGGRPWALIVQQMREEGGWTPAGTGRPRPWGAGADHAAGPWPETRRKALLPEAPREPVCALRRPAGKGRSACPLPEA